MALMRSSSTSMKAPSGNKARHAARSFRKGDIRLAIQINPASAKSFATSPGNVDIKVTGQRLEKYIT